MLDYTFTYQDLEYFLLIFVRVASFIFIAPFFSIKNTPRNVRTALSFFVAVLLYHILPETTVTYDGVAGYAILVMKEVITGLLIGFGANFCTSIMAFAGQIADMEMGLSMASMFDPTTQQQTTISGVIYNYMILLMLIISGMYRYLLSAFVESYTLIPVNGAVFHFTKLMDSFLYFMTDYIIIGFRICLPIFCVMVILNAILGVLAKVSPQLNMFAVGLQLKVLVGIGVLFLSMSMLPKAADFIFTQMKTVIVSFVEGMS